MFSDANKLKYLACLTLDAHSAITLQGERILFTASELGLGHAERQGFVLAFDSAHTPGQGQGGQGQGGRDASLGDWLTDLLDALPLGAPSASAAPSSSPSLQRTSSSDLKANSQSKDKKKEKKDAEKKSKAKEETSKGKKSK